MYIVSNPWSAFITQFKKELKGLELTITSPLRTHGSKAPFPLSAACCDIPPFKVSEVLVVEDALRLSTVPFRKMLAPQRQLEGCDTRAGIPFVTVDDLTVVGGLVAARTQSRDVDTHSSVEVTIFSSSPLIHNT
jgi:hypothetical protein